jgi:hypothetical protein
MISASQWQSANPNRRTASVTVSNQRLLVEYLANRRPGEEIVFSEIRSVLEWSDETIITMMDDLGLGKHFAINMNWLEFCPRAGSWFSHQKKKISVKDQSILEALSASLDDKEDSQSGALAQAKSSTDAEHFSAVFQGKAKRIAEIKDTRMH